MNGNLQEQTDELRRLALQIAIQLPEGVADARRVLRLTEDCLDKFLVEQAVELTPRQRALRLGWRLDGAAEDPPAAADPGGRKRGRNISTGMRL